MNFFTELKRRNVIRVGIAYMVGSWLLAQAADLALDVMGAPDIILRSLVAILALGFVPAVIFAWAFEITPEGIKKEKNVDRTQSITNQTAKKLDIATMALVIGAVALLALDRFIPSGPDQSVGGRSATDHSSDTTPNQKSLAVLPFVDMSPEKDNEYFTDGLTEELLNILAQIKSLQVAGRTSSFAFKGKTEDLREIGEKLNVNTLLEGSVRKDDVRQKIRVTVQLINVEDGYHIWSDTYDRDLEDIFAIQEDIARRVAEALKINLLGEEATPIVEHARTGMNAYDLYLKGLASLNLYTFESLREAESLFTESLAIDPDYQPTKLALVRTWLDLSDTGALPAPKAIELAEPLLDEILAEDPLNSYAHTYRGQIQEYDDDKKGAQESYSQALESNPRNAQALIEYGRFLFNNGSIEDGMEMLQTATGIEPYDMKVQWQLCITQAFLVDVEGATRECARIGEIQPGNPMEFYGQAYVYLYRGELASFLYWRKKAIEADPKDPELPATMAGVWLDLGDVEQAEAWLQNAARLDADHPLTLSTRIQVLLQKEQFQQAVTLAQAAYDQQLPSRQGSKYVINNTLIHDAVIRNDYDKALNILLEELPDGIESPMTIEDPNYAGLLAGIAHITKLQNPLSEEVGPLLNLANTLNQQNDGRNIPFDKPLNQAFIETARGDKAAALISLQQAIDKGWRLEWRDLMYRDFWFESLRQEPEFKNMTAMLEADMEKQRDEAYKLLGLTR
ncbi:MAG: tetratricopeptide repeat protein [Xanthomonadales bacterium]|nr:tetratricopeptide repeat protein [Xanthomonadales bacterium]